MKFKVYRDDLDPSLYIYSDNIPKYSTSPMHIICGNSGLS